jgi:hypothetical protein
MKRISLTKGMFAMVDDEDYLEIARFKWHAHEGGKHWYSARVEYVRIENELKRIRFYMHQVLCVGLCEEFPFADHKDGDGLNNTRSNLRPSNKSNNAANRPKDSLAFPSSIYKGVSYDKSRNKWAARIEVRGKVKHLGRFKDECDAAQAYNFAAEAAFGEFASYNMVAP